jgi:hypothetical protein
MALVHTYSTERACRDVIEAWTEAMGARETVRLPNGRTEERARLPMSQVIEIDGGALFGFVDKRRLLDPVRAYATTVEGRPATIPLRATATDVDDTRRTGSRLSAASMEGPVRSR